MPTPDPAVTATGGANSAAGVADYLPRFYTELRRLARARLARGGDYTLLDTTALVHESFLRLQRAGDFPLNDSEHFLAYATKTMRSVVVDYARRRKAERHGGPPRTPRSTRCALSAIGVVTCVPLARLEAGACALACHVSLVFAQPYTRLFQLGSDEELCAKGADAHR